MAHFYYYYLIADLLWSTCRRQLRESVICRNRSIAQAILRIPGISGDSSHFRKCLCNYGNIVIFVYLYLTIKTKVTGSTNYYRTNYYRTNNYQTILYRKPYSRPIIESWETLNYYRKSRSPELLSNWHFYWKLDLEPDQNEVQTLHNLDFKDYNLINIFN